MTATALIAILVGALEIAGGLQELVVQGILNNQRDPLIGGTLGAVAGAFLLVAGIVAFQRAPAAARLAACAVAISVPVFVLIGFVWPLAGWPARLLGIVVPVVLFAVTRGSWRMSLRNGAGVA